VGNDVVEATFLRGLVKLPVDGCGLSRKLDPEDEIGSWGLYSSRLPTEVPMREGNLEFAKGSR
jgi:hypothetical protein